MTVNSFQIPNQLVDEYLTELNGNELKILLVIIRKTKGWNKEYDGISISQFQKFTGIKDERTIRKAIKKLIDLGLIEKIDNAGKFNLYRLTPPAKNDGGQKMSGVAKNAPTPPATNVGTPPATNAPHKYTLPKDTNTKEYINKKNNTTSEKFTIESALKKTNIQQLMNELKVDSAFIYELEYHLKTLNKPIVNEKMLIALLRDIRDTSIKLKRSANEILEFMQQYGWKNIKSEWIENVESVKSKKSKKTKSSSLKELEKFGLKIDDDEIIDAPLIGGLDE